MFTEEELEKLGYGKEMQMQTKKVIHPVHEQTAWFTAAGLKVLKNNIYRDPVEPFFKNNNMVAKRIKRNWADSTDAGLKSGTVFPITQLEQQFNDYVVGM